MTTRFQIKSESQLPLVGAAASRLAAQMNILLEAKYSPHPFTFGISSANVEPVLKSYLTMSMAFPYIQAGAHRQLIVDRLARGEEVDEALETTAAVASFLVWDAFGGHAKVLARGSAALPDVLDTRAFHANLLRSDICKLLGKSVGSAFDRPTRAYLTALEAGLASIDPVERVAHMVAFERHAGAMIEALWSALRQLDAVSSSLSYFAAHVGGDDPAEAYHIVMTARMIDRIVGPNDAARFLETFDEAYGLNFDWCRNIKMRGPQS